MPKTSNDIRDYFLSSLFSDTHWSDAKCAGPNITVLFYPERSNGEVQRAKRCCTGQDGKGTCPVLASCMRYALENDERFGVWAGTSERERRKLRKIVRVKGIDAAMQEAHDRWSKLGIRIRG